MNNLTWPDPAQVTEVSTSSSCYSPWIYTAAAGSCGGWRATSAQWLIH